MPRPQIRRPGVLALASVIMLPALAQNYHPAINNGRVMDAETKFDAVRNVIQSGRIELVAKEKVGATQSTTESRVRRVALDVPIRNEILNSIISRK